MKKDYADIALIDLVMGYCAINKAKITSFNPLNWREAMDLLTKNAIRHPESIQASREVRAYYPVCHPDCHIERVQAFLELGSRWPEGAGPTMSKEESDDLWEGFDREYAKGLEQVKQKYTEPVTGNVVQFPGSNTKH